MKSLVVVVSLILAFSLNGKCQLIDTIPAKIIWVKNLKECFLIGTVSLCNLADTNVVISAIGNHENMKGRRKIEVGELYILFVEKDVIIASPTKRMSVKFKNTTVWTNEEPYKLKPRVCLNCMGEWLEY